MSLKSVSIVKDTSTEYGLELQDYERKVRLGGKNGKMSEKNQSQYCSKNILSSILLITEMLSKELPVLSSMLQKNRRRYIAVAKWFLERVQPKPNSIILDYGCGHPLMVKILRNLGLNIVGYEPFATETGEMHTAEILGLSHEFYTQIDKDTHFDHMLMVDVIEHLAVISSVMKEIHNLVKPGGTITISTPNVMRIEMWADFVLRSTGHPQTLENYLHATDHYTHHQREFTHAELVRTVRYFGFEPVYASTVDTRPDPDDLSRYHQLLGKEITLSKKSSIKSVKHSIFEILIKLFPIYFANNLLLTAIKID
jgi:2-polyprenyl-3-methyl-5-hydroxy-6-metoxy-1,4-benzoquinol methylase